MEKKRTYKRRTRKIDPYKLFPLSEEELAMTPEEREEAGKQAQEWVDRFYANPEEEIPKIAAEMFPDDPEGQEEFISTMSNLL